MPETWVPPSSLSLGVFLGVVAFVVAVLVALGARASASPGRGAVQTAVVLGGWMAFTAGVAASGVLELAPPVVLLFLLGCNGLAAAVALSRIGAAVAASAPLAVLVGVQGFRVPLEMVLHVWGDAGVVPMSMTWSGQNIDVFAGLVALVAAPIVAFAPPRVGRITAWLATVSGLVLLANVARVAVLSSPGPQRVFGDPPLMLAFRVPTVWIVTVCVAGALLLHVVTLRALLKR